jgi:PmbA protein
MSAAATVFDLASRVADRLRAEPPWDVYAERSRRFEVHLNGTKVELIRAPLTVEGYGVRLFRFREGKTGTGFQATTDSSDAGLRSTVADAEAVARHSEFPAPRVDLPSTPNPSPSALETVDQALWEAPLEAVQAYLATLVQGFDGRTGVLPSFGSVRATLTETSIANSEGFRTAFRHTTADLEVAIKAFGGPEGPPPGEYWVTESFRRLDGTALSRSIDDWCRYAQDVRRAGAPPTGELPVVLPPSVLSGILPAVVGFRLSGPARLRNIAPQVGDQVGAERVTVYDDGLYPWALNTGPCDDEGYPQRRRTLVEKGTVRDLMYDALHASAFDVPSTASALRDGPGFYRDWRRFLHPPAPSVSTLVVREGDGGTEDDLMEAAGDGIWVQQLGWANPEPISGAFGGEIRIGYRIRHGKRAEPVRGGTVGGLALAAPGASSLLHDVAALGSRAELTDTLAAPAMLIRPLVVAGA